MNQDGIRTTKRLVLLWKEETENPESTFEWLKGSWFSGHYHLRTNNRMYQWNWKVTYCTFIEINKLSRLPKRKLSTFMKTQSFRTKSTSTAIFHVLVGF